MCLVFVGRGVAVGERDAGRGVLCGRRSRNCRGRRSGPLRSCLSSVEERLSGKEKRAELWSSVEEPLSGKEKRAVEELLVVGRGVVVGEREAGPPGPFGARPQGGGAGRRRGGGHGSRAGARMTAGGETSGVFRDMSSTTYGRRARVMAGTRRQRGTRRCRPGDAPTRAFGPRVRTQREPASALNASPRPHPTRARVRIQREPAAHSLKYSVAAGIPATGGSAPVRASTFLLVIPGGRCSGRFSCGILATTCAMYCVHIGVAVV